jgi:hypothetical protein
MTTTKPSHPLVARWVALPRATKWALAALLFIGLYFGAIEPAVVATNKMNIQADNLEKRLADRASVRRSVADAAKLVEQSTAVFGAPLPPASQRDRSAKLERRVNEVFTTHKVQNQRTRYFDPAPLLQTNATAAASPLVPQGQRLDKLAVELTFETDVPTLSAILTDLERSPEVTAITRLVVRKTTPATSRNRPSTEGGVLNVTLAVEAWALTTTEAPRGTAPRSGNTSSSESGGEL